MPKDALRLDFETTRIRRLPTSTCSWMEISTGSCRCPTRPSKGEGYGWLVMERSPSSAALHEGMV